MYRLLLFLIVLPAAAQDAALDPSYGTNGWATVAATGSPAVRDAVLQPDGRLLVAGRDGSGALLLRFDSDGTRDASFGTGGIVRPAWGDQGQVLRIFLQADGRIVAAGQGNEGTGNATGRIAAARFSSTGVPDAAYGAGGVALHRLSSDAATQAIAADAALDPDGRLVFVGRGAGSNFVLARLTDAGALDPDFGTGGMVHPSDSALLGGAVAVLESGSIVAAARSEKADSTYFVRLLPSGALDGDFGTGGVASFDVRIRGVEEVDAIQEQPSGKLLVALRADAGGGGHLALVRLTAEGAPDLSYGPLSEGMALYQTGERNFYSEPAGFVRDDGTGFYYAGAVPGATTSESRMGVIHVEEDGAQDPAFGFNARVAVGLGENHRPGAIARQADGKVLLAGATPAQGGLITVARLDPGAARFEQAPAADAGYGTDGAVTLPWNAFDGGAMAERDGSMAFTSGIRFYKLTRRGTFDPVVGGEQGVVMPLAGKLARRAGGYVVYGSRFENGGFTSYLLALTEDGQADTALGADGTLPVADIPVLEGIFGLDDGGLLLQGRNNNAQERYLARLTPTGEVDAAFGTGGRLTLPFSQRYLADVVPTADGFWVLTGQRLLRLDASGALVEGFGTGGALTLPTFSISGDLLVDDAGRLVLARGQEVRRFLADGQPDSSFGTEGFVAAPIPPAIIVERTDGYTLAGRNTLNVSGRNSSAGVWRPMAALLTESGALAGAQPLLPVQLPGTMITPLWMPVDGGLLVAGMVEAADGDRSFVVARLSLDGHSVPVVEEPAPERFALRAWPSPAAGPVRVRAHVPAGPVTLRVYDALGRTVAHLFDGPHAGGLLEAHWAGDVAPGLYLLHLNTTSGTTSRTLVRVR